MLKNLTKEVTTAVQSSIDPVINITKEVTTAVQSSIDPVITKTASASLSDTLQDASKIISADSTSNITDTLLNNTISSVNTLLDPSNITDTLLNNTIPSVNTLLDPSNTMNNNTTLLQQLGLVKTSISSLATSLLGKRQKLVPTPTQILRRFFIPLFLAVAGLVIISIFMILFWPLIIVTSPIWIPTVTLFLLVTAAFLSLCGFVVAVVAPFSWA